MPLKSNRPVTPARRFTELADFSEITRSTPEKSLLVARKSKSGRNAYGRITVRHRGGGHKRFYRLIDFRRDKPGIPATVATIEYDPNRSARIALLHYRDGEKRYILATMNMKVGMTLMSGPTAEPQEGNSLPLALIPPGLPIHNIELYPGRGAQLCRSAGLSAQLMSRESGFAHIKLPSGEIRKVRTECSATIGQVGNLLHQNVSLGKAGRKRWLGIRPTVRGVVMNPIDHPMGGGEGRSSGGGHPRSPWGLQTKGKKTRNRRKNTARFIIQRSK